MGVVSNWEIVHSAKKLDLELKSWFKYPTFYRYSVEIAKTRNIQKLDIV